MKPVPFKTNSVPEAPAGAPPEYGALLEKISGSFAAGQQRVAQAVNTGIVKTYWEIGRHIVEFEQKGNLRAIYGEKLLERLSRDLKLRHGKGFSHGNLIYMRLLYLNYPKSQTLSNLLSWSHYAELLRIDDPLERSFYEKQTILEKWSIRELQRQKKTSLFLRFAAGKNKEGILQLAKQGNIIESPADLVRSPYVFDLGDEENVEGDNPPVGIILTREKDSLLVKYATYGMNSRLFVQKYQLYLPSEDELRREIERTFSEATMLKEAKTKKRVRNPPSPPKSSAT